MPKRRRSSLHGSNTAIPVTQGPKQISMLDIPPNEMLPGIAEKIHTFCNQNEESVPFEEIPEKSPNLALLRSITQEEEEEEVEENLVNKKRKNNDEISSVSSRKERDDQESGMMHEGLNSNGVSVLKLQKNESFDHNDEMKNKEKLFDEILENQQKIKENEKIEEEKKRIEQSIVDKKRERRFCEGLCCCF